MRLIFVLSIAISLSSNAFAAGDAFQCNPELFKDIDSTNVTTQEMFALIDIVDELNFRQMQNKFKGNLSLPSGINFGADYNTFDESRRSLHKSHQVNYSNYETMAYFRSKFSASGTSAYEACLNGNGLSSRFGLHLLVNKVTDEQAIVTLAWVPDPAVLAAAPNLARLPNVRWSFEGAEDAPGSLLPVIIPEVVGQPIPYFIHRKNGSALAIKVQSTAGFADYIYIPKQLEVQEKNYIDKQKYIEGTYYWNGVPGKGTKIIRDNDPKLNNYVLYIEDGSIRKATVVDSLVSEQNAQVGIWIDSYIVWRSIGFIAIWSREEIKKSEVAKLLASHEWDCAGFIKKCTMALAGDGSMKAKNQNNLTSNVQLADSLKFYAPSPFNDTGVVTPDGKNIFWESGSTWTSPIP